MHHSIYGSSLHIHSPWRDKGNAEHGGHGLAFVAGLVALGRGPETGQLYAYGAANLLASSLIAPNDN
jgi:hypothetical protein